MKIDSSKLKNPYIRLTLPEGSMQPEQLIQVKLDDEGVVIDVYDLLDDPDMTDPVASTWRLYSEMEEGEDA